jgi:predicted nucleic-acid-binding protein
MQIVDANIVLRYVLEDHEELSPKAKEIIDTYMVTVPLEVLCEAVFVLKGHYELERMSISEGLTTFFEKTKVILPHREAVLKGFEYYGKTTLDFVDCVLAGYYEIEKAEVHTFDGKLERLIDRINKV